MIRISMYPALEMLAKEMVDDVDGAIKAGMTNLTTRIEGKAIEEEAPHKRTGNLSARGITSFLVPESGGKEGVLRASMVSGGVDYASFVHDGTGIYGPHGMPIVPTHAKALNIPGIGYRKSTKGFKGRPFFDIALLQIRPQAVFDEGVQNFLTKRGW